MKKVIYILDLNNKFLSYVIGILAITMFVVIFLQVLLRYVFHSSLSWSEELARYLMVWTVFLGASVAFRKGMLVSVEFLKSLIPINIFKYFQILILLICLSFSILIIFYGFEMVDNVKFQSTSSLKVSMAIPYLAIPVGAIVLMLNSINLIIESVLSNWFKEDGGD